MEGAFMFFVIVVAVFSLMDGYIQACSNNIKE